MKNTIAVLLVTLLGALSVAPGHAAPSRKKAEATKSAKKSKKAVATPRKPKALPPSDPRVQAIFSSGGVTQAMGDVLKPQAASPAETTAATGTPSEAPASAGTAGAPAATKQP